MEGLIFGILRYFSQFGGKSLCLNFNKFRETAVLKNVVSTRWRKSE